MWRWIMRRERRHLRVFGYVRLAAGLVLTALSVLFLLHGVILFAALMLLLAVLAFWLGSVELDAARSQPPRT